MIISDIIEHVSDSYQAFKEIFSVLRHGGCYCFTPQKTTRTRVQVNNGEPTQIQTVIDRSIPPIPHGCCSGVTVGVNMPARRT